MLIVSIMNPFTWKRQLNVDPRTQVVKELTYPSVEVHHGLTARRRQEVVSVTLSEKESVRIAKALCASRRQVERWAKAARWPYSRMERRVGQPGKKCEGVRKELMDGGRETHLFHPITGVFALVATSAVSAVASMSRTIVVLEACSATRFHGAAAAQRRGWAFAHLVGNDLVEATIHAVEHCE